MKHLHHWILALLVIGSAGFSGARASVQEPPKKEHEPPKKETLPMSQVPSKELEWRDRAVRLEMIRKAMPTFKLTLVEAVQLAEKETGGKTFSADIEIATEKPIYKINLFVDEQHTSSVVVDPVTKKLTVTGRKPAPAEKPASEGGDGG